MKLKHVTFTGVDWRTDIDELKTIQNDYPYVEWGVLVAKNWKDNGNRYFNPSYLEVLENRGLNLSAHLCGSVARAAVRGDMEPYLKWARGHGYIFNRCQLNVSKSEENPTSFRYRGDISNYFNEVILQQESAENCPLFLNSPISDHITVLLDASGGCGINAKIEPMKLPHKIGYAGGINPDNVADKLTFLLESEDVDTFWIDMESGVRTDDWFDLEKVREVLEICDGILKL